MEFFKPYDICFFVSWSFMSEMTVGLFGKHRALDELHNPGVPTILSHLRSKIHSTGVYIMHLHTQTYHTSRQWNSLLQSHGHLILLACFVGVSSIQVLIIPFQTTKQTSLPKTPRVFIAPGPWWPRKKEICWPGWFGFLWSEWSSAL